MRITLTLPANDTIATLLSDTAFKNQITHAVALASGVADANVVLQGVRAVPSRRLLSQENSVDVTMVVKGATEVKDMQEAMFKSGIRLPMQYSVHEAHWAHAL